MRQEKQIVKTLLEWHKENRRSFPWRDEIDPYKVLIAEFFLQRTPANRVAIIHPEFIKRYPNPQALINADPCKLAKDYISLGLVKRMTWLVNSMKIVCENYDAMIPDSKELLKKLPGIGEYTASAILCFAFKKEVEIVDANIIRIYARIYNMSKKEIFNQAKKLLPKNNVFQYNEALLDFAALICKKNPLCNNCFLNAYCYYYNNK